MNEEISNEQKNEYLTIFKIFDKDNDENLNLKELSSALRSLGHNPTENDLKEFVLNSHHYENDKINFDVFIDVIIRQIQEGNTEISLLEAFKTFDLNNNNQISTLDFIHIMKNLINPLTNEEINEIISQADPNNEGLININNFVKLLLWK